MAKPNGQVQHAEQGAERSCIGAVLLRPEAIKRVRLVPSDFHDPRLREIWRAMLDLDRAGRGIDPVLLEHELGDRAAAVGGLGFLSDLVGLVPSADNIEHYAQIVSSAALTRRIRLACSEVLHSHLEGEELRAHAAHALGSLASPVPAVPAIANLFGHGARDFLGDEDDLEDDSADWVVRGLILRSAPNVIAGTPKSKKTLIALHLAVCIAAGEMSWLDRYRITQGRVLVLAHEDSKRETRRRLWRIARGLGIDPRSLDETLRIADRSEPFHFDHEAEMGRMVSTLDAWRPSVVFMDSLSRMHVGDENSKRDMNVVTDAWLTLAARFELALVSIHHLVKFSEARSLILQLRGSSDIGAAVRHAVGVARDGKEEDRSRLWSEGNSPYQLDPFDVVVTDDTDRYGKPTIVLSAADPAGSAKAAVNAAILGALAQGDATSRQLRQACKGIDGVRNAIIDDCIESLAKLQKIRRLAGVGPWKLV